MDYYYAITGISSSFLRYLTNKLTEIQSVSHYLGMGIVLVEISCTIFPRSL